MPDCPHKFFKFLEFSRSFKSLHSIQKNKTVPESALTWCKMAAFIPIQAWILSNADQCTTPWCGTEQLFLASSEPLWTQKNFDMEHYLFLPSPRGKYYKSESTPLHKYQQHIGLLLQSVWRQHCQCLCNSCSRKEIWACCSPMTWESKNTLTGLYSRQTGSWPDNFWIQDWGRAYYYLQNLHTPHPEYAEHVWSVKLRRDMKHWKYSSKQQGLYPPPSTSAVKSGYKTQPATTEEQMREETWLRCATLKDWKTNQSNSS